MNSTFTRDDDQDDEKSKNPSLEADQPNRGVDQKSSSASPVLKIYNFQKKKKETLSADSISSEGPEKGQEKRPVDENPALFKGGESSFASETAKKEGALQKELPRCSFCGEELPKEGLKFCPYCGKPLIFALPPKKESKPKARLHCNDCGKDIFQGNMRFCPYCGSSDLRKIDEDSNSAKPLIDPLAEAKDVVKAVSISDSSSPAISMGRSVEARHCPKCDRPLPLDFIGEYCPYCGVPLTKEVEENEKRCPSCQKILPSDATKFCPYCGASLQDEKPVRGSSEEAMRRYARDEKASPFDISEPHPSRGEDSPFVAPPASHVPSEALSESYPRLPFKLRKLRPAIIVFAVLLLLLGVYGVFVVFNLRSFDSVPFFFQLTLATYFLVADLPLSFLILLLSAIPLKREHQIISWACFLNFLSFALTIVSIVFFAFSLWGNASKLQEAIPLLTTTLDYTPILAQMAAFLFSLILWILLGIAKNDARTLEEGVSPLKTSYFAFYRPGIINLSLFLSILAFGFLAAVYYGYQSFFQNTFSPLGILVLLVCFLSSGILFLINAILHFPSPKKSKPLAIISLFMVILSFSSFCYGSYLFSSFSFTLGNYRDLSNRFLFYSETLLPMTAVIILFLVFGIPLLVKSIQSLKSGIHPIKNGK